VAENYRTIVTLAALTDR